MGKVCYLGLMNGFMRNDALSKCFLDPLMISNIDSGILGFCISYRIIYVERYQNGCDGGKLGLKGSFIGRATIKGCYHD